MSVSIERLLCDMNRTTSTQFEEEKKQGKSIHDSHMPSLFFPC